MEEMNRKSRGMEFKLIVRTVPDSQSKLQRLAQLKREQRVHVDASMDYGERSC